MTRRVDPASRPFSSARINDLAVTVEESGSFFYGEMELRYGDITGSLFSRVREEEDAHAELFRNKFGDIILEEQDDEILKYFDMADKYIFNKEKLINEIGNIGSIEEALEFAMRRELDTVLFYEKLGGLATEKDRKVFLELAGMEREHFRRLAREKEKIKGGNDG